MLILILSLLAHELVLINTWSLTIVSMIYSCWSTWTCTPQSWWRSPLDVILHGLYEIFLLTQAHGNTPNPHIELSRRPWVSTQTRNGQCLPYHGITWSLSVHLVRFVCWSSWFTLCLRSWSTIDDDHNLTSYSMGCMRSSLWRKPMETHLTPT